MKRKPLFWIFVVITILWIAFIFSNSLDDGIKSGEKSGFVTALINSTLQFFGFEGNVSEKTVRTLAHFGEFAILSVFLCIDLTLYFKEKYYIFAMSVPACFIVAVIDEIIQKFSAGRAMQFSDMLIDTLGALCATIIFFCIKYLILSLKKKKKVQ